MIRLSRIYLAVRKRVLKFMRGKYFVVRREGILFLIDIDDYVGRNIEAYGLYERRQIECLDEMVRAWGGAEYFMDIGANMGLYSVYFAINSQMKIIAFEPDKRCRYHLNSNVFLNNMEDRVSIESFALSDVSGVRNFMRFSDQNRGRSHISESGEHRVQSARLDDLIDFSQKRIVLKVDVEGHEKEVVNGGRELLSRNDCIIQMEIIEDIDVTRKMLRDMGYALVKKIGHDHYFKKEIGDEGENLRNIDSEISGPSQAYRRRVEEEDVASLGSGRD